MIDKTPLVGILMGSDSDLAVVKEAAEVLEDVLVSGIMRA